jgi:hypothetical protein
MRAWTGLAALLWIPPTVGCDGPTSESVEVRRLDGPDLLSEVSAVPPPSTMHPPLPPARECPVSRSAGQTTLVVKTTLTWGCSCPHFALATAPVPNHEARFLYPTFARGVADAAEFWVTGSFRLTGRYTGECMTYSQWKTSRGESPTPDEGQNLDPQPVFHVEAWCYIPSTSPPGEFDIPATELRKRRVPLCR